MSNSSVKLDYTNNTCCKKETFSLDLVDFGSQLQIHVIWKFLIPLILPEVIQLFL